MEDRNNLEVIKEYIKEHSFCQENIFKDWESFLNLLYSEGGCVFAILWYDHCKKEEHQMSVGSGGYLDPEDPGFIYAETREYENGLETKSLLEIKEYIADIRAKGIRYGDKYVSHDLVPAFYL